MALNTSIRLLMEPMRSLAFGSIGAAYMGVGTAFAHPIRIFHLQNLTDQLLIFSADGIDDHLALPSLGFLLVDVAANKTTVGGGFYFAQGDRVYVKEDAASPTSGAVYLTVMYGKE